MNAQMVYETWKKMIQNNIVGRVSVFPTEAEEYVLGDDSKFDKIPEHILWLWEYPKVLVEELGGEGAEMAKRCLRTFARLNKGGLFSGRDPKLLKRLGFTLKDILNHQRIFLSFRAVQNFRMRQACGEALCSRPAHLY